MRNLSLMSLLVTLPLAIIGQNTKEFSFEFDENEFSYLQQDNGVRILSVRDNTALWGDTLSPALPYIGVKILVDPDDEYSGISYGSSDVLVKSDITVTPNPIPLPTNRPQLVTEERHVEYERPEYPEESIVYTGTHRQGGYKYLSFVVCPFRYDALNGKLFLRKKLDMKLNLNSRHGALKSSQVQSAGSVSGGAMRESVRKSVINGYELDALYSTAAPTKAKATMSTSTYSTPYEYIIVTSEALRPAFERLARWKTVKGVRTKVVTVEECYAAYQSETPQIAIKLTLYGYSPHIQYALLGGDIDVVPAQYCVLPSYTSDTTDTPVDNFYGSFDNDFTWDANGNGIYGETNDGIDYDPDVIVTRAPVSTLAEAEIFVNRIIEYESAPKTDYWDNTILLCGNHLSKKVWKNGVQISDAQYQGEYVYEHHVQPHWDGIPFELFDTYTDHPQGADYAASSDHLQTELENGYMFVDEYSHAWANVWGWLENLTLYSVNHAASLVNKGYSTITTISCYSNAFDKQSSDFDDSSDYYTTCLSESFIRNPTSGVLAYFGSSREGWVNYSYFFNGAFYENLLSGSDKQFGRAAMQAKNDYVSYIPQNGNNLYRWLILTLNPIGDPEMPLFVDMPQILGNVNIELSHNGLQVSTGTEGCTICISSAADSGESYYEVYENVAGGTFENIADDCYLCITKPGYIPYVARVGSYVYLQDETISKDLHIFSTDTYAGSNVTNQKPEGPVSIEKGKVTNAILNTFVIENDFEVKAGAELEISVP